MNKTIKRFISVILCMMMLTGSVSAQTVTVTNSYANCRSKAGASNTYMGRVYAGQTYELLDTAKAPNGKLWYKIQMDGKQVYICSAFAKLNQTNNDFNNNANSTTNNTNNSNKKTLKITYSCNVRSAAGQNNRWLGRANYGNAYAVLDEGKAPNGKLWYKIQYGSQIGWVCSSFVKMIVTNTTTTTTTSTPASTTNVTTITTTIKNSKSPYRLSASERELVERCVTTEAGGESYKGQIAVAQVILNRARRNGQTVTEVIKAPNQFAYTSNRPTTQSVRDAVSAVFDDGETVFGNDVVYFCAPKYMSNKSYNNWIKGKSYVVQIGVHKFFKKA